MSLFQKILQGLGLAPAQAASSTEAAPATPSAPANSIDIQAHLQTLAAKHPEKLNWQSSIVDLLKLLGLDSSLGARKELATELGCPAEKMADSAQMNIWLHKAVLKKVADNGGNVPSDLLN